MMHEPLQLHNQPNCVTCFKPLSLCVCDSVVPLTIDTKVLILQHPQEPDKELGSARLSHLMLPSSTLRIGLSWRNLEHALGTTTDRKEWGVLYLGSYKSAEQTLPESKRLFEVNKKGQPINSDPRVGGLIVLDGTWSQAKNLWWRNAWLSKLRRLVLLPSSPSLYGKLRREPRKEGLSTIESLAMSLAIIEDNPSIETALIQPFSQLLIKYRGEGHARVRTPRRKNAFHRS